MVSKSRTIMSIVYLFIYLLVVIIVLCSTCFNSGKFMNFANEDGNKTTDVKPETAYFNHRKLMLKGVCTKWDLSISQSPYPTPGIPHFIVQIVNTCVSKYCEPSDIHLHCGWFASVRLVNPNAFKRLSFDDCLVNGGHPLKSAHTIRFTYANSFMYPIQFKSANFC